MRSAPSTALGGGPGCRRSGRRRGTAERGRQPHWLVPGCDEGEVEGRAQGGGRELRLALGGDGDDHAAELGRDERDGAAATRARAGREGLAVGRPQGEDDVALAEDGGRRRAGAGAGRDAGLERIRHGDDVDPGAGRQGGPDRLGGIDRQGEGDLPGGQRCPEAQSPLAGRLLQRATVDRLAGQDRQRGVLTDDLVDRVRGVRPGRRPG